MAKVASKADRSSASAFGFTPNRVPIAAWMVQANPTIYDIGTALADAPEEDSWSWSCHPTYRVDLVDRGQPCFLWVTRNDNPMLVSGLWLVGETAGPCYITSAGASVLWRDVERRKERKPYLPMMMRTLAEPITREMLLEHPVLRRLEVLRVPSMSNPQIITPEQLGALRSDFDLSTAPLSDEIRDAIRSEYLPAPELWVQGPGYTDIEVEIDQDTWTVSIDGKEVSSHSGRDEAYAVAAALVSEDLPISSDSTDWLPVAVVTLGDRCLLVYSTDVGEFTVYVQMEGDDEEAALETRYRSLPDALGAIVSMWFEDH